jgi:hypothetical protein
VFNYIDLVDYYYKLFSPENVLVLPYEMLRDSASGFLGRLGDFTGKDLAGFAANAVVSHNKRRDDFLVPRFPFLNMFRHKSSVNCYSPLYLPGSEFMFDAVDRLIVFNKKKRVRKVKRQIDEIIGDRYTAGNRRLSERIGIDLQDYDY